MSPIEKIVTIGLVLLMLLLATSVFAGGTKPTEAAGVPKWLQIKWDLPKPWAERLKGIELADQISQSFIDKEDWLKDQPEKTVAVGGYISPEEVQKLYGKGIVDAAQSEGHFWASGMVAVKPFVLFYRPSVLKEATGLPEPAKT